MELSKGANTPIPTSLLAVVISWRSEHMVDAHALLLNSDGTVRDDKDLVFYNAPRHMSQAVTLDQDPAPGTARLSVSLPRTEADVDRIVVSGSLEDTEFTQIEDLRVTVYAVDGPVAEFAVTASEAVTAMMFGEFYRRDGGWRFRAVGQGWATGMEGLVTEFGIQVDDPSVPDPNSALPASRSGRPAGTAPAGRSTGRTPGTERANDPTGDSGTAVLTRAHSSPDDTPRHGDRILSGRPSASEESAREAPSTQRSASGAAGQGHRPAATREHPAPSAARSALDNTPPPRSDHRPRAGARNDGPDTTEIPPAPRTVEPPRCAAPATGDARRDRPSATARGAGSVTADREGPGTHSAGPRSVAEAHPGNAHYRLDERTGSGTAATAPWDRFEAAQSARRTPGTVTLRRLTVAEPIPVEPPPGSGRADWYRDPTEPTVLRWWDGEQWTADTRPAARPHPHDCTRCGARRRRRVFGGHHPCATCAAETEEFLIHWHTRATRVLAASGPRGAEWDALWASLRYQRIDESAARDALEPAALQYVERRVAFAFADGQISADEYDDVEHAITELSLAGRLIDDLRARMGRGRALSRLREGDLPTVRTPDLHLDAEELVYLDIGATHIRELARGPKHTDGRLIVSTKKLRFVGPGTGVEIPWSRIVSVAAELDTVVVAATSARGGASFAVADPEYLAAALEGALRIAKRLVLAPGQRDSRSIPQEVKAEVWQRDGGKCVECGESHYLEFDHIIPLSRGGATSASNLQILCRGCNRAKGANI
ncbi:TerD family protein [Nocardia flavorosea]|uniref:TerD family protein n=1 Tax=Nocardia flavorosea TaxID=53429 RepID=UPI0007A40B92|nr:TerD family protein [Nocardia flavorosea]